MTSDAIRLITRLCVPTLQGIFSLALPHRTGTQCREYYRTSAWFRPGEEELSRTLGACRRCLIHHKAQLEAAWTSSAAQQVDMRLISFSQRGTVTPLTTLASARTPLTTQPHRPQAGDTAPLTFSAQQLAPLPATANSIPKPPESVGNGPLRPGLQNASSSGVPKRAPKRKAPGNAVAQGGRTLPAAKPQQRNVAAPADESSDDEFVAGTLRGIAPRPSSTAAASIGSSNGRKAKKIGGKDGKSASIGRRRPLVTANGVRLGFLEELAGIGEAESERLTVIRLDRGQRMPGWAARHVQPYTPGPRAGAAEGRRVVAPDILSFDFSTLRVERRFVGAIINAPLATFDEQTSTCPRNNVRYTVEELARLPLGDCLADDAIVCVWSEKEDLGALTRCMAEAWGCKYVENLTWVHLAPSGQVASGPARFTRRSHSTLILGRRGSQELELRHQRNADVIIAPALGDGRFPDAVREMLETLLPDVGGGDGGPRLLEVAFQGAEAASRPGWVTLAQEKRE